jgi:hypothetical protein
MNEMHEYYATPEAELGGENTGRAGFQGTGRAPTQFGDTLTEIVRLLPKVILPLVGYAVLWGVLYFVSVFVLAMVAGASAAIAGPVAVVAIIVGVLFVLALGAFFWTVAFKRLDNVYQYGTKGGEFGFAMGKVLPVMGAFFLKGLVMLPFMGGGWVLMFMMIERATAGFGTVLLAVGMFFLLQLVGWIAYTFVHFADLTVICEDSGAIAGLNRSFELVKGFRNWFYMVGLFMVVVLSVWVVTMVLYCVLMVPMAFITGAGAEIMGPEAGLVGMMLTNLLSFGVSLLSMPVFAVANYLIFQSLRARWQIGRDPVW